MRGSRLQARELSLDGEDDTHVTEQHPPLQQPSDQPLQPHQPTPLSPPLAPPPLPADDAALSPLPSQPPPTASSFTAPPPPPPPSAPSPRPGPPPLASSASSSSSACEVFEIEDFSTATAWERLVVQLELRCVEWGIDRGRLGRGGRQQQRCELLHLDRSYQLRWTYHSAAPVGQPAEPALFLPSKGEGQEIESQMDGEEEEGADALLCGWLGVRSFLLLCPSSASRKVSRHEASLLLSALSVAAAAAQCAVPLLVSVGERWKKEYWGITTAQSTTHTHTHAQHAHTARPCFCTGPTSSGRSLLSPPPLTSSPVCGWCAQCVWLPLRRAHGCRRPSPHPPPRRPHRLLPSAASQLRAPPHTRTRHPSSLRCTRPSRSSLASPPFCCVSLCSVSAWSECRRAG